MDYPNLTEPSLNPRVSADRIAYQQGQRELVDSRAEEYRRLARGCLALASTSVTAEARSYFIDMARIWARLADEQDSAQHPTRDEQVAPTD